MNQLFIRALEAMETTNSAIADFQTRACTLADALDAKRLLEELELRIKICLDTYSKDELPFYYLITAYCHLFVGKFKEAEKCSIMAIDNFRICDMAWNEAVGHWFLGTIFRSQQRGYLYLTELNKALSIVNPIAAEYIIQGKYAAAMNAEKIVEELEEQKKFASKMGTGPLHAPTEKTPEKKTSPVYNGYLILPWLPKYDSVRAGPNGIAWVNPPAKNGAVVHAIEIDGNPYRIASIHSSPRAEDHQITLVNGVNYGWAKVKGQSMNASTPVPIEDGDYVLFSMQFQHNRDGIVIASHHHIGGEHTHMVKKYIAKDRILLSETTDVSDDYSPIHLVEGYQILGAVIAVAKPIE